MKDYGNIFAYEVYEGVYALNTGEFKKGYGYYIFRQDTKKLVLESNEWFEGQGRAELAAIGHISMLEHGE